MRDDQGPQQDQSWFAGWNTESGAIGPSDERDGEQPQQDSNQSGGSSDTNVGDEDHHDSHREQPGPSATGDEARGDSENGPSTNNESSSHGTGPFDHIYCIFACDDDIIISMRLRAAY